MRKEICRIRYDKYNRKLDLYFAWLPTLVAKPDPHENITYLIWLESYEMYNGCKFLV